MEFLEPNQIPSSDFFKAKKKLSSEEMKVAVEKTERDALKEMENLVRLLEAANVERAKSDALKEEIQRLRGMPGRKFAVLFINIFSCEAKTS